MRFGDAAGFAWASLRKRRLRTFLTASGVMIGIGALVSMIAFGKGIQKNVAAAFAASDLFNTLMVMPGGPDAPAGDPDRRRPKQNSGRAGVVLDDAAVAEITHIPGVVSSYPDTPAGSHSSANGMCSAMNWAWRAGAFTPSFSPCTTSTGR